MCISKLYATPTMYGMSKTGFSQKIMSPNETKCVQKELIFPCHYGYDANVQVCTIVFSCCKFYWARVVFN